jgi:sulfatase modifying factor 1
MLKAGSLIFEPPDHPVDTRDWMQWWTFKFGANWHRPYGHRSSISGLDDNPVVHVTYRDAEAYAKWANKDLPAEAEFEFAARGGLVKAEFTCGNEFTPENPQMANTWQGMFPFENSRSRWLQAHFPGHCVSPNGYGVYHMIGNVWEWASDWYSTKHEADAPCVCRKPYPS